MSHRAFSVSFVLFLIATPPLMWAQEAKQDEVVVLEAPAIPDTSPTPDLASAAEMIVEQTNAFRKEQTQAKVLVSPALTKAAKAFAEYMAKHDRYGHTADDRRPAERTKAQDYDDCIVLENIAYAYDSRGFTAEKLRDTFVSGWQKSPGHRKNMLDANVTQTGVAVARSSKTGYYYAVQMFGRPKSLAIEFKIENRAEEEFRYELAGQPFTLQPRYTRTHTVCRPPTLTFRSTKSEITNTLNPKTGDRFVIVRSQGEWAVSKP